MLNRLKSISIKKRLSQLEKKQRIALAGFAVILVAAILFLIINNNKNNHHITVSGTIEATEVHLGSEFGGRVEGVYVNEGDSIETSQMLVVVNRSSGPSEKVRSPMKGTVLERTIEPGEIASPGTTLLVLADLDDLYLTVYVPEDRYGKIFLGQTCSVQVDSYPQQRFNATVRHIADQAEFTPRNVQTTDSRKSTVFAIKLALPPSGGKLKPGMPADLTCAISND